METISDLKLQQDVLMELYAEFDRICKLHNIPYLLFAGSALGAIRHQDIIPWDDDLDVVMLRKDYDRFLEVAKKEINQDLYYLQSEFSNHWPMFFSKIRKNNTTFIERLIPKDPLMHQGVYIDIFPCDNLSNNGFIRKLQFLASKVIIAKALDQRGYATNSMIKKVFILLSNLLPKKPLLKFVKQIKNTDTNYVHTFFGAANSYEKNIYPRRWFEEVIYVPFGQYLAPVSKYYDEMLTKLYGDYMTPLEESKRSVKVHGVIVDLNCNYTHYLDAQKEMEIEEYSRSIR